MANSSGVLDRAGTVVGTACAVHCTISAFAPVALAAALPAALWTHSFEWGVRIVALILAAIAAYAGFRVHRNTAIAGAIVGCAVVLVAGGLLESAGRVGALVSIAAGIALAFAHFANLRASRRCKP